MSLSNPSRIVFGIVAPAAGSGLEEHIDRITDQMSAHMGISIQRRDAASYEALAADVRESRVDVAWLPPIVFVRLGNAVTPLGSILRGGAAAYEAALIVRADSKVHTVD